MSENVHFWLSARVFVYSGINGVPLVKRPTALILGATATIFYCTLLYFSLIQ